MNGIVIVDKPQDWTSQDVTARLRRVFSTRRIGHGGTLDPMATGVLPVFVGRATRGVEFFEHAEKTYETVLRLGLRTDTQDITGTVLEQREVNITEDRLLETLERFRGEIMQVPPMYSAIKVNGKKLYELARKGREVERQPRPVTIYALELLGQRSQTDFALRVVCSKGTYVRTLCHDIGAALGCGGAMAALRRTRVAGFTLENALTLDDVCAHPRPETLLRPVDGCFADLPAAVLTAAQEKRVRCGAAFTWPGAPGLLRAYGAGGEFLALCEADGETLRVIKSFFEV